MTSLSDIARSGRVFIIAEAGVNHNGDPTLAERLIDVAAQAEADAVKFQTFNARRLVSRQATKAVYQLETTDKTQSQLEMLEQLELPLDAYPRLQQRASDAGLVFLSSPFEEDAVDFLDDLRVPAFKIPSGEITNLQFLAHVGTKHKPVLLSTGMSTMAEVEDAVKALRSTGAGEIILLQCTSNYPADPRFINLQAMLTMKEHFGLSVGFSDHTEGIEVALAAVALGAVVIEKHFTLDRKLPGPDHQASLEPRELQALVRGIRKVESALGSGKKEMAATEKDVARVARRSIVALGRIPQGTVIDRSMLAIMRPGNGLPPKMIAAVVGRTAKVDISEGTLLTMEMLQ